MADAKHQRRRAARPEPNFEANVDAWEAAEDAIGRQEALVVSLDGFEGPLDVLLALAHAESGWPRFPSWHWPISIWPSSRKRLKLRLELAADYLVMAAWLAYLKSRLLLPREIQAEDQPSGDELAGRLAFRLKRLEAMRNAAAGLMTRKRLGRDIFARGMPEGVRTIRCASIPPSSTTCSRPTPSSAGHHPARARDPRRTVWSIKEARQRLGRWLGS